MSSTNRKADIIFMGTPDFAVPSLAALVDNGWNVVCVVTQPDRPQGRKRILTPPAVKEEALRRGLPVFQPERCRDKDAVAKLRSYRPDLIVTAAYGQLLPKSIIEMPPLGCINVHASLLPRYRGGAPIHHAVMQGEAKTGITIMYMDEGLDTGAMIAKAEVNIGADDTTGILFDKLKHTGAQLLLDTLPALVSGQVQPEPQKEEEATYAPNITREDERIDWNRSARQIHDHIRGLNPWPVAYTIWNEARLKLWASTVVAEQTQPHEERTPGTIIAAAAEGIDVACGEGVLRITELQPSGKRKMKVSEFMRGANIAAGMRFGGER